MVPISHTVLLVDDDPDILRLLEHLVEEQGFTTITAHDGREAIEKFGVHDPNLVILDLTMPEMGGLEVLEHLREIAPETPVIILTAETRVPMVVEAMRQGAYDFLVKPVDPTLLSVTLRQASERLGYQRQVRSLEREVSELTGLFPNVVANSAGMKRALRLLRQVRNSNVTVLMVGESGTGKSLLVRELHRDGPRADGPFIAVNCAAIPDALLESELFGHERGAFTGADSRRIGKFEAAQGGILFLDEVGDLGLPLQAKLLNVLQEREITRLGSNEPIALDVRVIAATNSDLEERIRRQEFRRDLYYRLAVVEVDIPPLRDRRDDIEPLLERFIARAAAEEGRPVPRLDPAALEAIVRYDFPGNIRQLENVVARAVIMFEGDTITLDDLPASLTADADAGGLPAGGAVSTVECHFASADDVPILADVEHTVLTQALKACGGNITLAAKRLKVGRATIYRRLRARELDANAESDADSDSEGERP